MKLKTKKIKLVSFRLGLLMLKKVTKIPVNKYPAILSLIKDDVKEIVNMYYLKLTKYKKDSK